MPRPRALAHLLAYLVAAAVPQALSVSALLPLPIRTLDVLSLLVGQIPRPPTQLTLASMSTLASSSRVAEAQRCRPSGFILSSPSSSHAPGTLFPEMNGTQSRTGRIDMPSRRHTTYLASPNPRPLRSSPLAGPSLALNRDGTLAPSDDSPSESDDEKRKPSRISSSPDVPGTLASSARSSSEDGPADPRSASSPQLDQGEHEHLPPLPVIPSASRLSRRLSWGLTKLAELPDLSRASSTSSQSSSKGKEKEDVPPPPVPEIPPWARHTSRSSPSLRSTASSRRSSASIPSTPRRPTTASSDTGISAARSLNRHSTFLGKPASPSVSRDPELNWLSQASPPKFSRTSINAGGVVMPISAKDAKFANRRSAIYSSPPRPTTPAQAVLTSRSVDSSPMARGKYRDGIQIVPPGRPLSRPSSMASLGSAASEMSAASGTLLRPPSFRLGSSSSSIDSALSSLPPVTPTSLSRTASTVVISDQEKVDELGVLSSSAIPRIRPQGKDRDVQISPKEAGERRRSVVFELRVDDVRMEVKGRSRIESLPARKTRAKTKSETEVLVTECSAAPGSDVTTTEKVHTVVGVKSALDGTLSRGKGTIKRVWKRMIGTVSVKAQ